MCIKCVAVSLHVCSFMRFCIRNVRISSTLSGCASQVKDLPPPKKKTSMEFPGLKNLNSKMLMVGKGEECHSVTPILHGPYNGACIFH